MPNDISSGDGGGVTADTNTQIQTGGGSLNVTKAMLLDIPEEKLTPELKDFIKNLHEGPLTKADLEVFLSNVSSLADLFKLGGNSPLAGAVIADTVTSAAEDDSGTILGKQIDFLRQMIAEPHLLSPNGKEATEALLKAISTDGDGGKNLHYNKFLGGLVGVALLEAMMEYMKTQQVGAKISSEMWLEVEEQTLEMAAAIAKNIESKAEKEAMEKIATAILSAGTAVVNFAGFGAGRARGGGMTAVQETKLLTDSFNTILTGVANNLIQAQLGIQIGKLDAEKTIMEAQKDILQQMMQKIKESGDDYNKNFESFNEALKAWMTKLTEANNKLTTK